MVTLGPDGEIFVDNRKVGELVYDENHIEKIEIDSYEQNQGYGTRREWENSTSKLRLLQRRTGSTGSSPVIRTDPVKFAVFQNFHREVLQASFWMPWI
ncbi:MAG: hypothetical protein ABEJ72_06105 [Candidatus Aenigmatarchaeota archaeon]